MGRGRYQHCAIREPRDEQSEGMIGGTSWCGKPCASRSLTNMEEGEDPLAFSRRTANCTECSKAMGKLRLAQISDRVKLEKAELRTYGDGKSTAYRSAWHVVIDGQRVADLTLPHGFGNPWQLHEMRDPDADNGSLYQQFGRCLTGERPRSFTRHPADRTFQPIHYESRDMMASAALKAFDNDEIRTPEQRRAIAEERRKQQEAEEAQRKIDREERKRQFAIVAEREKNRKTLALDGIAAVLERTDLSNLERAGVEAARDIIEGKSA